MDGKASWSVVILFEDAPSRDQAREFCEKLIHRFWTECEFQLHWYSFAALQLFHCAVKAADKAAQADLMIFAARAEADTPSEVRAWTETWLDRRNEREGTLVGLFGGEAAASAKAATKHSLLRDIAHRAGMDYLTQMPEDLPRPMPDSIESYTDRAECITCVLDEILHQKTLHPHLDLPG